MLQENIKQAVFKAQKSLEERLNEPLLPLQKPQLMAVHNQFGKKGEEMAQCYFQRSGYTILHRNWRYLHYEIDLIAQKGKLLHFIEVKIRSSGKHGLPEESVTRKKLKFLLKAADEFLYQNPQYKLIQFDILAITMNNDEAEYFLIEDVYL